MLALVNTPNGKAPVELRQIRRRRVVGDGVARSGREWRGGGVRQFLRRDDKHQLCRFPRRAKCALAELLLVHFGAGGAVCAGSCIAGVAGRRQVAGRRRPGRSGTGATLRGLPTSCATGVSAGRRCFGWSRKGRPHPPTDLHHGLTSASICVSPVPQGTTTMPPSDRKGTLFGGDAVHVALILQTRATARRARNALSRLLRRYHAAEPASARDRGTIVRKHISGLHRRGVSTAVHSATLTSLACAWRTTLVRP